LENIVAKSQKKSNREAKKPKQNKKTTPIAKSPFLEPPSARKK